MQLIMVIALIYLEYSRSKKLSSPLIFWYVFWGIIIIIARVDLGIYNLGDTWNDKLLGYVVINSCSFYLAFIIVGHIYNMLKTSQVSTNKTRLAEPKLINDKKLAKITIIIFTISNIAFLLNSLYLRNIPQLSSAVNLNRINFVNTPLFSIVNVSRIAFVFVPFLLSKKSNEINKKQIIIQTGISMIFNFLTGWRGYIFQILIMLLTTKLLMTNWTIKIERKKERDLIVKSIIFALLLIGGVAVTRANSTSYILEKSRYVQYTFEQIYLYVTPNFLNFQQALNTIKPNNNFMYTSEFIWGLLIKSGNMPGYKPLSFSTGAFNVSTYLLHPYADFGLFGTILWSTLIGGISSFYFEKSRTNKSIINLVMVSICNVTIFTMHNGFFLRSSSVVIWILIAIVVNRVSLKRNEVKLKLK